jgi:hypothetical protein
VCHTTPIVYCYQERRDITGLGNGSGHPLPDWGQRLIPVVRRKVRDQE